MTTQKAEADSMRKAPLMWWIWIVALVAGSLYAQDSLPVKQEPSEPTTPYGVLWLLILVILTAFFSAVDGALRVVHGSRVRELVEQGVPNARLLEQLLDTPNRSIATAYIGTILSALLAVTVSVEVVAPSISTLLHQAVGATLSTQAVSVVGTTLLNVILVIAIGILVPHALAERYAEPIALRTARLLRIGVWLLAPIVATIIAFSNALVKPFKAQVDFSPRALTPEEIISLVDAGEEQGVIEEEEREMIQSVLEFPDTIVRKVMTPRIDMHCVSADASLQEVLDTIRNTGHSRIPVYEGTVDNIIGVVYAKDLLRLYPDLEPFDLRRVMRPPYFIPETKKVDDLMREFRSKKTQIAIVRDEYGGTSGLVTLEDILEELVGEIHDEYDIEESPFEQVDEHTYLADGRTSLEDVNDKTGLHLPTEEYDTIGGFVFGLFGRPAQVGEQIAYGRANFIVEEADGRRIRKVRIEVAPAETEEEQQETPQTLS